MEQDAVPSTQPTAGSSRSQPLSTKDWEDRRDLITQLYSMEDKSLEEVVAVMKNDYGFKATKRQYIRRISQWHLDKNVKDSELRHMAQKQKLRAINEDKDTLFRVRGRSVDPDKISRAVRRKNISDDELLSSPAASTPADITYYTPSAFSPRSPSFDPAEEQSLAAAPAPTTNSSGDLFYAASPANGSDGRTESPPLMSRGSVPETPPAAGWYAATPQVPSSLFTVQTPPDIVQFSDPPGGGSFFDGSLNRVGGPVYPDNMEDNCGTKRVRLVELVKKTERTEDADYMNAMLEVNSLVYDLISSDQSKADTTLRPRRATIPQCHICQVLDSIGAAKTRAKVASERILLEAIAISEGRFGEHHSSPFHFLLKLFFLYKNWTCRVLEMGHIMALLLRKAKLSTDGGSNQLYQLLEAVEYPARQYCPWLQDPQLSVSTSLTLTDAFSTLQTGSGDIQNSPRLLCEKFLLINKYLDYYDWRCYGPILDLVVKLGPVSVDGSSFFWMAIFVLAVAQEWEPIFESRFLICNAAKFTSLTARKTLEASLGQLLDNPYRLPDVLATSAVSGLHRRYPDDTRLAEPRAEFDEIGDLEGPLRSLEELAMVLAEASLKKVENGDNPRAVEILQRSMTTHLLKDTVDTAARLGNSQLITCLSRIFNDPVMEDLLNWSDMLNLNGEFEAYEDSAPICFAAKAGHQRTVEALIDAGADPNGQIELDTSPLQIAAEAGHHGIVCTLIERGAKSHGDEGVLRYVINSSDEGLQNRWIESVLRNGEWFDLFSVIILIGQAENYVMFDNLCESLRDEIEQRRKIESDLPPNSRFPILEYFLRGSLELDDVLALAEDSRGLKLLLNTLTRVHVEHQARQIWQDFITAPAGYGLADFVGSSELRIPQFLVSRNAHNALRVFLRGAIGPDLDVVDHNGNTALHIAAGLNRHACARELLKSGINLDITNAYGETALQVCSQKGSHGVLMEIRERQNNVKVGQPSV